MEIPGSVELPGFGHMSSGRVQIPSSVKISGCVKISGRVGRAEKTTLIPFLTDLQSKFQNHSTFPSGRKVMSLQRKKERKKEVDL